MFTLNRQNLSSLLCLLCVACLPLSWIGSSFGSLFRTMIVLIISAYLIVFRGKLSINKNNSTLIKAWAIYAVYVSARSFFSANIESAIYNILGVCLSFVIAILFSTQKFDEVNRKRMVKVWLSVGVISVLLFLLGDRSGINQYTSRTTLRILGSALDPNEFASIFVIIIPLCASELYRCKRRAYKLFLSLFMIVCLYCVLLTGSRGALLSVLIALGYLYVKILKKSFGGFLLVSLFVLIAGFILLEFFFPLLAPDVVKRFSIEALMMDQGSGRSSLWLEAINKLIDGSVINWLFGFAYSGLRIGSFINMSTDTMHNQFVQELISNGFIGFVLYIYLLVNVYKNMKKYNFIYLPILIGMICMSLTITMGAQVKQYWFLLMMAFLGEETKEKDNREKEFYYNDRYRK